jgi:GT2 family glycosyltransferase
LRRILYHRHRKRPQALVHERALKAQPAVSEKSWPGVGIILPTRDRPELLEGCLEGLKTMTDYPDFEVIVIDNGTVDKRAVSMLAALRSDPRFKVIRDDGPFNYSRLCNAGVRATEKPYLTFLNNDILMRDRNWLKALIEVCRQPRAGVVGAKLLFPNGQLQHAGVVLGTGGLAGHCYFNSREDTAGYLSELGVIREVSAVTGACCALERAKFLAVGGLDEINFPIELNDIHLCLQIAEKGWQNYWTPKSSLIHFQSASRGVAERPSDRFAQERTHFLEKWAHVARDDPYFHPALSLFAHRPALG